MKLVPATVTRNVALQILKTKKNSPHIFFAAGVVGVVGTTVLACRATLKLEDLLDEIKDEVETVNGVGQAMVENDSHPSYTEKDLAKDKGVVYTKNALKVAKLYAPAIILGTASIAALTGSHVQLTRRNSALTATVAILTTSFEEYRDRVRARVGEDAERDIYHDVTRETQVVDGKKVEVAVQGPNGGSPYARLFDMTTSSQWRKDAHFNRTMLTTTQTYMNHQLRANGHVLLNDVFDALGLERTTPGCVVGWVWNSENGDNHVDFGLFNPGAEDFMSGQERSVWLDFNVDGVVYNLISGGK